MNVFKKAVWSLDSLSKNIANVCIAANAAFLVASVILRLVGSPISGATDVVGFVSAVTIALSVPYAELRNSHIRVELLESYLPPKGKKILLIAINIINALIIGILSYRFLVYMVTTYELGSQSWVMYIPFWPIALIAGMGMFLYFLTIVVKTIEMFRAEKEKKV